MTAPDRAPATTPVARAGLGGAGLLPCPWVAQSKKDDVHSGRRRSAPARGSAQRERNRPRAALPRAGTGRSTHGTAGERQSTLPRLERPGQRAQNRSTSSPVWISGAFLPA